MASVYGPDLAYVHDCGFGQPALHAARTLRSALYKQKLRTGLVLDLGCGSGLLSAPMAAAGYDVHGIDLSPAMIALAQARVPSGRFEVRSFLDFDFPPCVAVAAVGEIFNYLFDERNTDRRLRTLLERIYRALLPGGVLLCDLAGPGRVPGKTSVQKHVLHDDWAVLVTANEDRRRKLLTRQIVTFRRVGDFYRREEETHRLRLYSPPEVLRLLRGAGFRPQRLAAYAGWRFPQGWTGFLSVKP